MQLAIARDYFPAYARLPRKAQSKADEFIRKFLADPKQASIHYEPIRGTQDKQLRSVRIGDDYRAIVRAPERGDVFVLLWVDHHDEAYRWAASKRTAVHPATGTLQLFDLDAAAQVLTSLAAAPEAEPAKIDEPRLFAKLTDDELFLGGVPRVLLPAVRAIASEEELDQLAPHLPAEAAQVLTGLAAGFSLDVLLEEILGSSSTKAPDAAPSVDPADVAAALERPSTRQQFRIVDASFDLETALAHPLDVWRVYLHPKQAELVRARTKGPMRVTGGAGTGKTVVALHRAAFLVREVFTRPDDRLLLTTFTVNLALDLKRQLEKLLEPQDLARVDVKNIDGWAAEYLRSRGEHVRLATNEAQDQAWQRVMDIYAVEGFGMEFCKTEWRDVVQAQDLRDEEAYVRAVRTSRGLPLGRRERRALWPIFRAYRQEFEGSGFLEPVEILRRARKRLEAEGNTPRYRAVVVDETQDMSLEALRLLRVLAGPERPDDMFLVGDAHQRIYGRPVKLGSAGINVRGRRSQELRLNYRTTAAICRWSLGALGSEVVDDLDEGVASGKGYVSLREGQPPSVHAFEYPGEEVDFVVAEVKRLIAKGTRPEGICIAARRIFSLRDRFVDALVREGIAADVIDREEPRHPSVRLATMHRIKGLEFPVVFVVSVNAEEVPYRSPELESNDAAVAHRAEVAERCLLYVATSRARDALYVTSFGEPSPFLKGMGAPPKVVVVERRDEPLPAASVEVPAAENPPAEASPPPSPSPLALPIDSPELRFPTRLVNWAEKKGIKTVADLTRIPPRELLSEQNLGRKTIADTRVLLESMFGTSWETLAGAAAGAEKGEEVVEDPFATKDWDVVRRHLPEALLATKLDEIDLPARMANHAEREGLKTVADLAARSKAQLLAAKNLGRTSIPSLVEALRLHLERTAVMQQRAADGLLECLKTLLQEQDAMRRLVFTRRAGLGCEPETLKSIGDTLGMSRERARQLESAVLADLKRERAWLSEVSARIDAKLKDGAVALDELSTDPWWAGVAAMPSALDYFGETVMDNGIRVLDIDDRRYLAQCTKDAFESAWEELRKRAARIPLPTAFGAFRELAEAQVPKVGRFLAGVLLERLRELLHIEEAGGEARVVGFGDTKPAAVLALLRASPTPMRVEEITERLGRLRMPDEVLFFDRGLVGLSQHFPDFEQWMEKLVPRAFEVMQREPPERQWLANELAEELREAMELPAWLDHWHLASVLRKSGRVRYLGRNRFALLEAPEDRARIQYRDELVRMLREHGEPMAREELIGQLRRKTSVPAGTAATSLARPPFLHCESDKIGLLDRDLPGGTTALVEALEHMAGMLERRGRGLGAAQVVTEISRLSQAHASWPLETCMSVLRSDPRFRLSQSGAVGLSQWESVRVPTRAEIVRQCLDDSGGRVTVEAVQRQLEAYYGSAPDRVVVGQMANRFGAVLRGEWMEREGGD